MSSILKALKRVEEEKAARNPEAVRIDSEILRDVRRPSGNRSALFGTGVLLIGCGALATYLLLGTSGRMAPSPAPAPPPTQSVAPPHPPETATPGQRRAEGETPVVTPTPPARIPRTPDTPRAAESALQPAQPPAGEQKNSPPAVPVSVPASTAEARPRIKVDGIAYQGDSSDSVAVVNGTAVANGSSVDGVKVLEIKRDRVLFEHGRERFEVMLGATGK